MAKAELFRIGEVARRAGVNRGTIQHYLREGLLPKPVKTHRNMAWYDESFVERIKQIKELQTRRFLPLSVIKRLLGPAGSKGSVARSLVQAGLSTVETSSALVPRDEVPVAIGLTHEQVDDLLRIGLVSAVREAGREVFAGPDVEVLAAVASLERHGFSRTHGFSVDDLSVYKELLQELLNREVATFLRNVGGKGSVKSATRFARPAIEGATMLVLALRRKLIRDLLAAADSVVLTKRPKK